MLTATLIFILFCFITYYVANLDCNFILKWKEIFGKKPVKELKGKIVWITGASAGIGEALALELSKLGCKLILSGTKVQRLENVAQKCLKNNAHLKLNDILVLPFDITNIKIHQECFNKIIHQFKSLDILVNNAGIAQSGSFEDIELALDRQIFEINVFGPLNLTRVVCNYWLNNEPQLKRLIVLNSSTSAILKNPWTSAYVASKMAISGYLESAAKEYWNKNISLCVICPGPIETEIFTNSIRWKVGLKYEQNFVQVSQEANVFKWLSTVRCAQLMTIAMANKQSECWIAKQPILAFTFISNFLPFLAPFIWKNYLSKNEKFLKKLYLK